MFKRYFTFTGFLNAIATTATLNRAKYIKVFTFNIFMFVAASATIVVVCLSIYFAAFHYYLSSSTYTNPLLYSSKETKVNYY